MKRIYIFLYIYLHNITCLSTYGWVSLNIKSNIFNLWQTYARIALSSLNQKVYEWIHMISSYMPDVEVFGAKEIQTCSSVWVGWSSLLELRKWDGDIIFLTQYSGMKNYRQRGINNNEHSFISKQKHHLKEPMLSE